MNFIKNEGKTDLNGNGYTNDSYKNGNGVYKDDL